MAIMIRTAEFVKPVGGAARAKRLDYPVMTVDPAFTLYPVLGLKP
jgi:hypothetical protein